MRKAALDKVHELARRDPRVLFIGSDLGAGTLDKMRAEFPDRWFMEGIAEANMIGMAAGLAMEGFVPYLNTIAPFFTRRANEQIAVDLCLHNLPVRMISSGGGVVYAPLGSTHLAFEDMAAMRVLPNMTVVAVSDAEEMRRLMDASLDWPGPMYIRLAKGGDPVVSDPARGFAIGKAIPVREPGDVLMVTTGVMLKRAMDAADELAANGIRCGILHMHTVKPLDSAALLEWAGSVGLVVTIEEHSRTGGLGSAVAETLVDNLDRAPRLLRLGLPDAFPKEYGSQETMFDTFGLLAPQVAASVRQRLRIAAG
ncbi:MAG: transketolase C-terminal domain-containing protein [Phaeospirillum sp.]|nr:transketolase C-terminal domain-containing protein [Phaeospirillum sp.]